MVFLDICVVFLGNIKLTFTEPQKRYQAMRMLIEMHSLHISASNIFISYHLLLLVRLLPSSIWTPIALPPHLQSFDLIPFALIIAVLRCSVMSDSLRSHGLQPTRLLCQWDSPGKNTGVGSHSFLQRIFPDPGIEARSLALQLESLLSDPPGKPC